jgi:hypothetical protein
VRCGRCKRHGVTSAHVRACYAAPADHPTISAPAPTSGPAVFCPSCGTDEDVTLHPAGRAICRHHGLLTEDTRDLVYVSRGWSEAFHRSRTCPALRRGQAAVTRRGGAAAPVESMTRGRAHADGRMPCRACAA